MMNPESLKRALRKGPTVGLLQKVFSRPTAVGVGRLGGLIGIAASLFGVDRVVAEPTLAPTDYRAVGAAPVEWRNFTKRLQQRLQERFAAEGEDARQLREVFAKRASKTQDRSFRLRLRAWVEADGKVERIELDGFDDDHAAADHLRRLLRFEGVGAPPPDMLQPLRLGLSLRLKDDAEGAGK